MRNSQATPMQIVFSTFVIFFYLCGGAFAGSVPGLFEQNADDVMLDISRHATSVAPNEMTYTCHFIPVGEDTQKFCITTMAQGRGTQVAVRESMSFVKAASIVTARDADDLIASQSLDTVFLSLAYGLDKEPRHAADKARALRNEIKVRLRRAPSFRMQGEGYVITGYPKADELHIDIEARPF